MDQALLKAHLGLPTQFPLGLAAVEIEEPDIA
jgi:hypothetical protein